MTELLRTDPCLVAGSLVAGHFEGRGYIVRDGFLEHPKVRRWLVKHGSPPAKVYPDHDFTELAHDAIRY